MSANKIVNVPVLTSAKVSAQEEAAEAPVITNVQMAKGLFVPSLFELKRTLNRGVYPGITMTLHVAAGVMCSFRGVQFLVPFNMIECIVYGSAPTSH